MHAIFLLLLLELDINNEKAGRKRRASDSPQANSVTKPPQKLRCPNGNNLFVRVFYKSEGIDSYMYMLL